jgi:hypothetical protein
VGRLEHLPLKLSRGIITLKMEVAMLRYHWRTLRKNQNAHYVTEERMNERNSPEHITACGKSIVSYSWTCWDRMPVKVCHACFQKMKDAPLGLPENY